MIRTTQLISSASIAIFVAPGSALAHVPTYSDFELQARANLCANPAEGTHNLPCNASISNSTASINDDQQVAIKVFGGDGTNGIWFGAGGNGSIVYSSPVDALLSDCSLNNNGLVAFPQTFSVQNGIYLYDSASNQTTFYTSQPLGASSWGSVEINNQNQVGYRAGFSGSGQGFFSRGSNPTQAQHAVEASLDPESPYSFLFSPTFNNNRQIASVVRLGAAGQTGNSQPDQVRIINHDETVVTVAEDADSNPLSMFASFDSTRPGLTDEGRVSFIATLVGGGRGVFLANAAGIDTIATTSSPDLTAIEFFPTAVNNDGMVAFRGKDANGDDAIYVGDGTTLRKVVKEHDILPTDNGPGRIDQHDNSVVFGGSVSLNATGDLTFQATLTPVDNNQIEWGSGLFIAYADPDTVPGDVTGDGHVNVDDLLAVINGWGDCPVPPAACNADIAPEGGNGVVNVDDLLAVINNWG